MEDLTVYIDPRDKWYTACVYNPLHFSTASLARVTRSYIRQSHLVSPWWNELDIIREQTLKKKRKMKGKTKKKKKNLENFKKFLWTFATSTLHLSSFVSCSSTTYGRTSFASRRRAEYVQKARREIRPSFVNSPRNSLRFTRGRGWKAGAVPSRYINRIN